MSISKRKKYKGWKNKPETSLTGEQRILLEEAEEICDEEERSTEYMIEFMQEYTDCTLDEVIMYIKR